MKGSAATFVWIALACFSLSNAAPAAAQGDFFIIPVVAMTFRGDWNANTNYNAKDIVFYSGSSWFSLVNQNKGNPPGDVSIQWTLLAQKGDTGAVGAHNHDERYFTETETDALFSAKAPLSHHHGGADITAGTVAAARIDPAIARKAAVDAQIDALTTAVSSLQATVTALQGTVNAQQATITELTNRLSGVSRAGDTLLFSGMNLQVVSGSETTDGTVNGKGNLIIGYNEPRELGNARSGSHNLIVGKGNNYSSYGGVVAGYLNSISGQYASVSGGHLNTASGYCASISADAENTASGVYSSITGGDANIASRKHASISGGQSNKATGIYSSVTGGYQNTAGGDYSSVSGGYYCSAGGPGSSVSGGYERSANGDTDWRGGSYVSDY